MTDVYRLSIWIMKWYDELIVMICGTAATRRKWIEAKMKELGVTSNADYRLCMMLDDLAMITVDTPTYGVIQANSLFIVTVRAVRWSLNCLNCLAAVATIQLWLLNCCFSFRFRLPVCHSYSKGPCEENHSDYCFTGKINLDFGECLHFWGFHYTCVCVWN